MHTLLINSIALLGLLGFLIAWYIHRKKTKKKRLVCPMRSDCDTVIHSDYSRVVGIPVEVLGMIYYAFIGAAYPVVFVFGLWSVPVSFVLVGISMCSVLFSIYLVSIQAFIVRQWCIWCLCSAAISLIIFVLSYIHIIVYPA